MQWGAILLSPTEGPGKGVPEGSVTDSSHETDRHLLRPVIGGAVSACGFQVAVMPPISPSRSGCPTDGHFLISALVA